MQTQEAEARAQALLLSHPNSRELMQKKSEKLGNDSYKLEVKKLTLKPGRLEAMILVLFPDREGFEAAVDIYNDRVDWIKTLGAFHV